MDYVFVERGGKRTSRSHWEKQKNKKGQLIASCFFVHFTRWFLVSLIVSYTSFRVFWSSYLFICLFLCLFFPCFDICFWVHLCYIILTFPFLLCLFCFVLLISFTILLFWCLCLFVTFIIMSVFVCNIYCFVCVCL